MDIIKNVIAGCVGLIIVSVTFLTICLGWGLVISNFEYKTWNKLHSTNYSLYEWWTGSDFIKKYHYPGRDKADKKEININLNQ